MRKLVFLPLAVVFLASAVSADFVINSDDWRDIGKGIEKAESEAGEFFVVDSPGELYVAEKTLNEGNHVLLESSSPALTGLRERSTLKFSRKENISWRELRESDSYVIIGPEFGTDMVSVLPYVLEENHSLVFYTDSIKEEISSLDGKKIFYGRFGFDPGRYFDNVEHIDQGWRENNFEVVSRMEDDWATISPRTYFNPEIFSKGDPILLRSDLREMSAFLENSSIENLRVIGYNSLVYAQRLKDMTRKDLNIVVKTGRVFTGSSELQGRYELKKIDITQRSYDLEVEDVYFDSNNSRFNLQLVNSGSADRRVNISGSISGTPVMEEDITVPSFTSMIYGIDLDGFDGNISLRVRPEVGEEIDIEKGKVRRVNGSVSKEFRVNNKTYNRSEDELKVNIGVTSDSSRWVMVQSGGKYEKRLVEPGRNETIVLDYISDEEVYSVMGGSFQNQFETFRSYRIQEEFLFGAGGVGLRLFIAILVSILFLSIPITIIKLR